MNYQRKILIKAMVEQEFTRIRNKYLLFGEYIMHYLHYTLIHSLNSGNIIQNKMYVLLNIIKINNYIVNYYIHYSFIKNIIIVYKFKCEVKRLIP
jgi:hypothetical protein